jgi:hypothetical protein
VPWYVCHKYSMHVFLHKISSETLIFNFGYQSSGYLIYVSKDVRICGYFAKPKGVREEKSLTKPVLHSMIKLTSFSRIKLLLH